MNQKELDATIEKVVKKLENRPKTLQLFFVRKDKTTCLITLKNEADFLNFAISLEIDNLKWFHVDENLKMLKAIKNTQKSKKKKSTKKSKKKKSTKKSKKKK